MTKVFMQKYDPELYWESLISSKYNLQSVGYPWLPLSFNRANYRACEQAVEKALEGLDISWPQCRVLDVGCGTSFWVNFWKQRGAREIMGVDIAPSSIANCRRLFPESEFFQQDISSPELAIPYRFNLISAINVLLHLTEESRFERAITNIANLLTADGYLIILDAVILHRWWGIDSPSSNCKTRHLQQWEKTLNSAGLAISKELPVTWLLADPIDTRAHWQFTLLSLYWRAVCRAVASHELASRLAASLLYPLDQALLRLTQAGPSAKCLLVKRKA